MEWKLNYLNEAHVASIDFIIEFWIDGVKWKLSGKRVGNFVVKENTEYWIKFT